MGVSAFHRKRQPVVDRETAEEADAESDVAGRQLGAGETVAG